MCRHAAASNTPIINGRAVFHHGCFHSFGRIGLSPMPAPNVSSQFLIASARIDLAESMVDAVLAFTTFESKTLGEYAALRECYRSTISRIDASYQAQIAIRKAQFFDGTDDGGT
jgi:hypothetical protein